VTQLTQEELDTLIEDGVNDAMASRIFTLVQTVSAPFEEQIARYQAAMEKIIEVVKDYEEERAQLIRTIIESLR
jgi:hypothetical protein